MRAVRADEVRPAALATIEREVFAEDAQLLRGPGIERAPDRDGLPETAQERSHRRIAAGFGQPAKTRSATL